MTDLDEFCTHCEHWAFLEACCDCGAPRFAANTRRATARLGRIVLVALAVLTLAALVLAPGSAPVPIPTPTTTEAIP